MSENDRPAGIRPIDAVKAELDQVKAGLDSLNTQVAVLLFCCIILSIAVGLLLWPRK